MTLATPTCGTEVCRVVLYLCTLYGHPALIHTLLQLIPAMMETLYQLEEVRVHLDAQLHLFTL